MKYFSNEKKKVLSEFLFSIKNKFWENPKHRRNIVFCFLIIVGYFALHLFLFSAPKEFPVGKLIPIKEGSSLRSVSKSFDESNIIRSRVMFETLVMIFGDEEGISAGDYLFTKKTSVFGVAMRIAKKKQYLEPIRVVVFEGFNREEIAKVMTLRLPHFNEENFLKDTKDKEGYLFPDTYFFLSSNNESDVIRIMQNNFDKKIISVSEDITSSGKTLNEIITMASIIEGEASGDSDRNLISGILWKRLKKGMLLQVDVAPDTYKEKGLPKKPIANPGLKSIKAALHPKDSSYLYYLHDKSGNVYFAKNYDEHKANINRYLK